MKSKKLNPNYWIFLLMAPLFILVAFRDPSVGNDTLNYFWAFSNIAQENMFASSDSRFEIGYIFLVRLLSNLGFDYFGFQVVTTFFIYFAFGSFIRRYSINYSLSIFIFLTMNMFFDTMNITRSYLALSILLLSVKFIEEKKPIKFLLLVGVATLFHTSAIIFLLLYPLSKVQWSYKKFIQIIIMGAAAGLLFDKVVNIFVNLTGKYSSYLDGKYFTFENNIAIYVGLSINLVFLLLGILVRNYWPKTDNSNLIKVDSKKVNCNNQNIKSNIWFSAIVISFVISVAGLNSTIMSRVEMYFSVLYIVFIPDILSQIRNYNIKILVVIFIIILLLLYFFILMIYRPNWFGVIPYNWFSF
ncbi:EpsG family protein [Alkalihalophilus pseudofirmus]|uniref:EpsG family protein n=1 Tax=Alkalihalophilus pseudofirmus TaxID=79885 RepID=UPI0023685D90